MAEEDNRPFSEEEVNDIFALYMRDVPVLTIARKHGRSRSGIEALWYRICKGRKDLKTDEENRYKIEAPEIIPDEVPLSKNFREYVRTQMSEADIETSPEKFGVETGYSVERIRKHIAERDELYDQA